MEGPVKVPFWFYGQYLGTMQKMMFSQDDSVWFWWLCGDRVTQAERDVDLRHSWCSVKDYSIWFWCMGWSVCDRRKEMYLYRSFVIHDNVPRVLLGRFKSLDFFLFFFLKRPFKSFDSAHGSFLLWVSLTAVQCLIFTRCVIPAGRKRSRFIPFSQDDSV